MFRIFTFKNLTVMALILCIAMLSGSTVNTVIPYIATSTDTTAAVPIIMYHQISENPAVLGDYAITPELLRNDFEYMRDNNIHPISFTQLNKFVKLGEPLPENPIIITFDDGERTFLTKVLPLLKEFSYPANVNIVGSLVELYTKNGSTDDRYAYLNENDLKLLSSETLVEIGYHSYDLHSLSGRRGMAKLHGESVEEYEQLIREDIRLFQDYVYSIMGEKTSVMAYPYGIRNDKLLDICKDSGFHITLTCRETVNHISVGSDLYELGRFNRPNGKSSKSFLKSVF